jgi:hypothetical protein
MQITRQRFTNIHAGVLGAAIVSYIISISALKSLQPALILVGGLCFFILLHADYFAARLKLAALLWVVPAAAGCGMYGMLIEKAPAGNNAGQLGLTALLCLIPAVVLVLGSPADKPTDKPRLKIIKARIIVQCLIFMLWALVTAISFIKGSKIELVFWGSFHALTVALCPFLIGRALCSWLCPNAIFQDGLFKNLDYARPIAKLPRAIEAQSSAAAVSLDGPVDENAPMLPATLLMSWFPMFFFETVFDLTGKPWYPITFISALIILSALLPWRKLCTYFCCLSSYRCLAGQNSLWRIRFNKANCRSCKKCRAEESCPFYIDIRNQDNEMPATCSLCFNCMEACPFDGVITFKRGPEEKKRLKTL